jgi:hypothetical protein
MAGKTFEQRLEAVDAQIKQKEAQERNLIQQLKEKQRKERTRRLVQIGAFMAKLGVDTLGKAQAFQAHIEGNSKVKTWLAHVTAAADSPTDQ